MGATFAIPDRDSRQRYFLTIYTETHLRCIMYVTKAFNFLFLTSRITMAVVGKYIIVTIVKIENEIYFFFQIQGQIESEVICKYHQRLRYDPSLFICSSS